MYFPNKLMQQNISYLLLIALNRIVSYGVEDGTWIHNLCLGKAALHQLSYSHINSWDDDSSQRHILLFKVWYLLRTIGADSENRTHNYGLEGYYFTIKPYLHSIRLKSMDTSNPTVLKYCNLSFQVVKVIFMRCGSFELITLDILVPSSFSEWYFSFKLTPQYKILFSNFII